MSAEAAAPEAEAAAPEEAAEAVADGEEEDEEPERGEPLFEVSDRRATILADKVGIIFRLDEEEADFTWDEIGAVEIDTPRFGKRFKVTVYTGPRRWFEAHVEAKSRSLLKTWTAELDAVLDEHFEDPDAKPEAPEDEAEETAEATEVEAEATDEAEADETPAADEAPEPEPEPASALTADKADKPLKPAKPEAKAPAKAAPAKSPKPRGKRNA
ncbi:hypothetical protein [Streptomyces sp. NPDC021020]|uniref:hypothetical protein n=1 Tax=Streptomyces sp. NPDC021020 TaxID=3365109 RepID=UPI0037B7D5B0